MGLRIQRPELTMSAGNLCARHCALIGPPLHRGLRTSFSSGHMADTPPIPMSKWRRTLDACLNLAVVFLGHSAGRWVQTAGRVPLRESRKGNVASGCLRIKLAAEKR